MHAHRRKVRAPAQGEGNVMSARAVQMSDRQGAKQMKAPISVRLSAVLLTPLILMLAVGWPAIAAAGQRQKAAVVKIAELDEVGDEVPIGKNRTDEACRLRLVQERGAQTAAGANRYQRYNLFCEGWTQPSGEIRRFRARQEFPPARLVSESGWAQDLAER